jgi:exo-1,4-beta-D-glucosaminidase
LKLEPLQGQSQVYFLDLKLKDNSGKILVDNFYWLATQTDKLDWSKYFWYYTPQKQYADFKPLNDLPKTKIKIEKTVKQTDSAYEITLKINNPSDKVAFFIEAELSNIISKKAILPVFWSDNYVSLLPNESKVLTVKCHKKGTGNKEPIIKIKGYNLSEKTEL